MLDRWGGGDFQGRRHQSPALNAGGLDELTHHSILPSTWEESLMGLSNLSKIKKGTCLIFWRDFRCSQTLKRNASTRDLPTRKPLCVSQRPPRRTFCFPGGSTLPPPLPAWLKGHNSGGVLVEVIAHNGQCGKTKVSQQPLLRSSL